MLTHNQEMIVRANGGALICGTPSFAANGLAYGSSLIGIWTEFPSIHRLRLGDLFFSHYHFDDDAYVISLDDDLHLYKPTAERALIDAVKFCYESYDEGVFIEALQNYIAKNDDGFAKLYEVADHYKVPRSDVDYWINEAREESDMSMG